VKKGEATAALKESEQDEEVSVTAVLNRRIDQHLPPNNRGEQGALRARAKKVTKVFPRGWLLGCIQSASTPKRSNASLLLRAAAFCKILCLIACYCKSTQTGGPLTQTTGTSHPHGLLPLQLSCTIDEWGEGRIYRLHEISRRLTNLLCGCCWGADS
jgi:hypothetical protein